MIHVGDITKLNGVELPVVDVITGGSPCQDLSVAGKRAGLAGERSGLFMEQVRIVKEMREHDRSTGRTGYLTRPRYMLWENVPGAFSSNKGEDFRAVLEEIAKVEQEDAHIPRPEGGWPYAGCVMGDGWSIAWRLHDAQFWGVPQRRKRIALVADFGGSSAPEILFERKGVSRDIAESGKERQRTAKDAEGCVDETGRIDEWLNAVNKDAKHQQDLLQSDLGISRTLAPGTHASGSHLTKTLITNGCLNPANGGLVMAVENHPNDSRVKISEDGKVQTLSSRMGTGGGNVPMVMESSDGDIAGTLDANYYKGCGERQGVERTVVAYANEAYDKWSESEKSASLKASGGVYGGGSESLSVGNVVRRLTPLECERLQGFPDGWTDIGEWTDSKGKMRKCSDSARYKALGNSIAIPFWFYILRRMAAQYERPATLGSLFDGIGGFPLCWERCNGKGTAIWASEIEEFPIAVTKKRFGDS